MLDLNLIALNIKDQNDISELPGFLVTTAPKRADHSRSRDIFAILLTFDGNAVPNSQKLTELLQHLTKTYYKTRGSATTGLRAVTEELNKILLKQNLQNSQQGMQAIGLLNIAVLRNDQLYIASSGPTHSIIYQSANAVDIYDESSSGRGIGLTRTSRLQFHHSQVQPGDTLIFSPEPPKQWISNELAARSALSPEHFCQRLLSVSNQDIRAAVIQFTAGTGEIHPWKSSSTTNRQAEEIIEDNSSRENPVENNAVSLNAEVAVEAQNPSQEVPIKEADFETSSPLMPEKVSPKEEFPLNSEENLNLHSFEIDKYEAEKITKETVYEEQNTETERPLLSSRRTNQPRIKHPAKETPVKQTPQIRRKPNWRRKFADQWLVASANFQRSSDGIKKFLRQLLPGSAEDNDKLSPITMLSIAIIIPIIVVAIATVFYLNTGKGGQHEVYLKTAQEFASQAINESDPTLQIHDWAQTIHWLDKAEEYGKTDQSTALRLEAQNALDDLDGIVRLNFSPELVGQLDSTVEITKIESYTTDVYLLDNANSRVLRLFLTAQGYALDADFNCASAPPVGKLVDFVTLPPNAPFDATVLATDSLGNYFYCSPDQKEPTSSHLIPPDNYSWGEITNITLAGNNLYVLDPVKKGIWIIAAPNETEIVDLKLQKLNFSEKAPAFLFTNYIPKLEDIIDIAVNGDDVYLLHENNEMTVCNTNILSFGQTTCTDPAQFGDLRPGRETEALSLTEANLTQLLSTQPPDPSIFILDSLQQNIYQFSLQLNLRRQLRPLENDEVFQTNEVPTAFTVTDTRVALLAFGNLLYQANLP